VGFAPPYFSFLIGGLFHYIFLTEYFIHLDYKFFHNNIQGLLLLTGVYFICSIRGEVAK
jgi:hypothetical protein